MPAHLQLEAPLVLTGSAVALESYAPELREDVRRALDCDPDVWELFASNGSGAHFEDWWARAMANAQAGTWISFAVRRLEDRSVVGSTSFINIQPERRVVEIGATFLRPDARGGAVNPEAKRLMLGCAFERGARRVEIITDARNERSRAAIAKLGAIEEGILWRDRVTWTGHVRDGVLFSISDQHWPAVRDRLDARLRLLGGTGGSSTM